MSKPNDSKIIHFLNAIEDGRIRVDKSTGKLYFSTGKLANARHKTGYLQIGVTVDGKRYVAYQHRVLFAYYHGIDSLSEELEVNHKNGDKTDNKEDNLELVTSSVNQKHKHTMHTDICKGSKNGMSKLTEETVREIKKMLSQGMRNVDIAKIFGLDHKHISLIRRGKRWSHVN